MENNKNIEKAVTTIKICYKRSYWLFLPFKQKAVTT